MSRSEQQRVSDILDAAQRCQQYTVIIEEHRHDPGICAMAEDAIERNLQIIGESANHLPSVTASPERCFELSLSVDANRASMADSGERAIGGVTSGVMGLGDTVTWRARHFGIPFIMTSAITAHDAPARFVDEQVSGPFRRWWHEHRFVRDGDGTVMTDVVEFESPAGPLGRVVNALVLTRYMTRLLRQRNSWLATALADRST